MVSDQQCNAAGSGTASIWALLAEIADPEMPYISIVDLGIVRDVRWQPAGLRVVLTPTYSGCPARHAIEQDIGAVLRRNGVESLHIETRLAPAWTTEWISPEGKAKMRAAGVAPPLAVTGEWQALTFWPREAAPRPDCPHCGSPRTRLQNECAGSRCKALFRCDGCGNPFEYFKGI